MPFFFTDREIVRTEKHMKELQGKISGCDYIQGYFYPHALPADEADSFYSTFKD